MILLVRHAMVDACGRYLAGRMPGIHLNAEGRRQAHALGATLRPLHVWAVYSSPRERARETAQAIAAGSDVTPVRLVDELDEIDFGEWTGLSFDELNGRDDWAAFNRCRASTPIPGGEWMRDVQMRACRATSELCRAHSEATIAIVSHGDVLRALVARVMDVPLDRLDSFRIDPASVSVLEPAAQGFELVQLNNHAYRDYCCSAIG
jgi:probable phosphoglycerate mutase